ncbi:MAG TPA: DUF2845 domain-containing protein [Polyangiales bacterium]|nr:DUF2845 domain-containing protein [Polyangiales bacterium]
MRNTRAAETERRGGEREISNSRSSPAIAPQRSAKREAREPQKTPRLPASLLIPLFCLSLAATAQADGSFRCKTRLVTTGAAAYEVKSLCGTPDDMQTRSEVRTIRRAVSVPCATGLCSSFVEDSISVNVEEWTYDFGPQRFIQFLIFEQGKLVQIKSGGYGKKDVSAAPP